MTFKIDFKKIYKTHIMGRQKIILSILFSFFVSLSWAHINPEARGKSKSTNLTANSREDCLEPQGQIEVEVNNVRARLLTGGDVWWDGDGIGRYVVPKPPVGSGIPEVSSIFAGSVWIGGNDPSGGLKMAANTYRTNGGDFSTGPLTEDGETDLEDCNNWDLFFQVTGEEVRKVYSDYDNRPDPMEGLSVDSIPDNVLYWPGKGNPFFFDKFEFDLPEADQGLGSFWDENEDGEYDPRDGDFPVIEIRGCFNTLVSRQQAIEYVPDEMTFWIYNDAGRQHFETMGRPIQMEIQVQAFAYATNDEINNMTFQRYKLINRASEDIRDCYFAMWVDPDLGCYTDDYVGCDVSRSLAYTYNQDALDGESGTNCPGGVETYKESVPIIGTDYFRGPLGPKLIVTNAAGDTSFVNPPVGSAQFDTIVELGMTSFMYHNNPGSTPTPLPQTADPNQDFEYYNYIQGLWRDGTAATFGGTGFNLMSMDTVNYMFPDDPNTGGGWSMCEGGLPAGDRRTIQASGPFLLIPGAVNELIIGAVWVPDLDYPCPDISRLQSADDLAQALFDNCFDIIDGPDAPDICAVELDEELILVLSNDQRSNNAFEEYSENDIFAPEEIMAPERNYFFEGYNIWQLKDPQVTAQEYGDPENSRLIRIVDVKNGVSEVYNWTPQIIPGQVDNIWIPERVTQSPDEGVKHTFQITEDAFTGGRLINHTKYYFSVVAYGHNEYIPFDPTTELGQRKPYLEGRKNIQVYTFIPRPIVYDSLQSNYGDGAIITRLQGVGVGGNFVDVDSSVYDAILSGNFDGKIKYQEGEGPIEIKIFNPLVVREGVYNLKVVGEFSAADCGLNKGATWVLTDPDGTTIASEKTIDNLNEQILTNYGFSISLVQTEDVGATGEGDNGAIGTELEYDDLALPWYNAVRDNGIGNLPEEQTGFSQFFNFQRTGAGEIENELDPSEAFSRFGTGEFYPYFLTSSAPPPVGSPPYYLTPAFNQQAFGRTASSFSQLNNVDIVMTSDRSKWSRCVVIETASKFYTDNGLETIDGAQSFDLRQSTSVDINGNPEAEESKGLGWFPGYAIDVETGERLNIFFGENSYFDEAYKETLPDGLKDDALGTDMLFNPGTQLINISQGENFFTPSWITAGGGHTIYVTRQSYDECEQIHELLDSDFNLGGKISVMKAITWTSMALTNPDVEMLSYDQGYIPTDLKVKLRVDNPYSLQEQFDLGVDGCGTVVEEELPEYEFEIRNAASVELTAEQVSSVLDNVNVVPNPYYGYSAYETSQFTNTVKITNLPDRAEINIFTLDGRFVKKFSRSERPAIKAGSNPGVSERQVIPDLEWDLKNFRGIPVASGVYLIHVVATDLGEERTIKWFGVNRKFDATGL